VKKTIQIADKPTVDEILALLKSSEIGLAVLRELLGHSADADTAAAIKALLENGTYGLNAIKSAIKGRANESTAAAIKALLENGTYGLNAIKSAVNGKANESTAATIKALLENGTYGLNAIKSAINGRANETTSVAIKSLLENGTYGLNALKNALNSPYVVKSVQHGTALHTAGSNAAANQQRTVIVNISAVNVAKSLAVAYASANTGPVMHLSCCAKALSTTSLQILLSYMDCAGKQIMVGWQVIEFY